VDPDRPFASAWSASTQSLGTAAAVVMTIAGVLLPWLLMLGGAIFIIRIIRRRMAPNVAMPQKSAPLAGTDA
nr:DUF4349 domain-containing protein [Sphingopyxis sp.]